MAISLEIGPDAIWSYRRLAYTPWHAIAEFVDNSTQSFFDNRDILTSLTVNDKRPLTVEINYLPDNDLFSVRDNAMGMSYDELVDALHVAQPPLNTSGRSKYGMGLKTAACWMGNLWTVKTKKYGETTEHCITVDVEKIGEGDNQLGYEAKNQIAESEHYTVIEVKQLNRRFRGRTLAKIEQYLSSMYRQDFRDEILTLVWKGKPLEWIEFDSRLLTDRDDKIYKSDFSFKIYDEQEEKEKAIYGWVGVLKDGSRSNAGFSILHSNRVIKGWPDSWRPSAIYGQDQGSNDLINQRLIGEVHLDDFEVSHTKDNIQWFGDQEEKVEQGLREASSAYREVARTYRRSTDDRRGPTEVETQAAVSKFQQELASPELLDIVNADPMLPENLVKEVLEAVTTSVVEHYQESFVGAINGLAVKVYVESDMSINDPYLTIDTASDSQVVVIVNAGHPHWNQLRGSTGVLNYLRHCVYDGIAEWQAKKKTGRIDPETIKLLKDKLLRLAFDIERHEVDEGSDNEDEELN